MPYNRFALISFACALITLISFCLGLIPVPFTSLLCYPLAGLMGLAAMLCGGFALHQLPMSGERGHWMAWTGLLLGLLMFLAVLCLSVLAVSLYPYIRDFIQQMLPTPTP